MRVRIMRNGTVVNTVDVKATNKDSKFDILRRIEAMQQTDDVLKTGMLGKTDLGIMSLHCKEGIWQVSEDNKGTYKFDGIERNLKLDIRMYETGFILCTGRQGTNLLGMTFESYLSRLGRTKIHCAPKDSAKVFPTLKVLKSFIEKNQRTLEYLVKTYGYEWRIEDANPLFTEDYQKSLSEMTSKKRTKELDLKEEINDLLLTINQAEDDEDRVPYMPDEITTDHMRTEAVRRMALLHMWDRVMDRFAKESKVFMSEGGGIIYDLDKNAEKAIAMLKDSISGEAVPYAVIHQSTDIGELYTVLYVSNNGKEWENEIPTAKGWLTGYVYNATHKESSEFGSVQVNPANGGLVRVA